MNKNAKTTPETDDYTNLVNLLSVCSEAKHRLTEMEANMNTELLAVIDEYKEEFAQMQRTANDAEQALEVIATAHPEWFEDKKEIKTPYGTVKFRKSSALVVTNEELSLELVERDAAKLGLTPAVLIRTVRELNLDAMQSLTDDELKAFRVRREHKENFSVVPAKVDLGKAVAKETATASAA